mgnify:CR=1 FL=1
MASQSKKPKNKDAQLVDLFHHCAHVAVHRGNRSGGRSGTLSALLKTGPVSQRELAEVMNVRAATLSEQIGRRRPNDKVKLSVKRDGAVKQIEVTLRNKAGKTELMTKEDVDVVEVLGGKFADAGTKLCRELDIKGGVQVVGIKADGILARARVKQGFVITHINDRPVYSVADMQRMDEKVRSIDGIYPNGRAASYTLVE